MSTRIIYTDIEGNPITLQKLESLNDYKKIYLVNNIEKKVEIYVSGIVDEIQYVKSTDENIDDIFNELGKDSITIITKEGYGDYTIKNISNYIDRAMKSSQKQLLKDNKILCD